MTTKRIQIPEIEVPEYDQIKHTIIGKHILFAAIHPDEDQSNPCEDMDGIGMIRSLSNRHDNNIPIEEARELLETDPDVIPLSYFEHGNSLWMVASLPSPAGVEFQWDGVRFAGIWIPDKDVRESYTGQDGLSRKDWMIEQAKSACEIYTQWSNGEIFYQYVKVYKLRTEQGNDYTDLRDYRYQDPVYDDACGGHYGHDYALGELRDNIREALSEIGFSKRAIAKALPRVCQTCGQVTAHSNHPQNNEAKGMKHYFKERV
jgi:hypothetical protein